MNVGTLTKQDKSASITLGINNITFWKNKVFLRLRKSKYFFHFHLTFFWITLMVQYPSSYQLNAHYLNEIDRLKND